MKRFLSIMIGLLLIGAVVSPVIIASNDIRKKKVHLTTTIPRHGVDRTLLPSVAVFYVADVSTLELTCYETKETTVYVLTSTGEELSCDTFNSDMTPFYPVDAPDTPGTYWIVIDSPVIYGEGSFVVE